MADEPLPSSSIIRHIRDLDLPTLERPSLNLPASNRASQPVVVFLHREIGNRDLVRVASDDSRKPEVLRLDFFLGEVELEVATVVDLAPLQLWVVGGEPVRFIVGVLDGDVLAVGRRRGDGSTGKLDAETASTGGGRVVAVVQPYEV